MKLSCIYSNRPDVFPRITFNDRLNVVRAKVTRPKDSRKDSHNLGKTLLLHLIDAMLLKGIAKGHFLYDNKSLFEESIFFLDMQTNGGDYVTVRRDVVAPSKIWLKSHEAPRQDFTTLPDGSWDYASQPFKQGRAQLNAILGLTDIAKPWDFRKGVGYCLRAQGDYRDVFQLAKFSSGVHSNWKPFMAQTLGLDFRPIQAKYELDAQIKKKRELLAESPELTGVEMSTYDKLKGALEIKRAEAADARADVERFNFYQQDMEYNAELVENIENQIATSNNRVYTIDFETQKLEAALTKGVAFDPEAVEQLFEEAQTEFPSALKHGYEELVEFNRKLSTDRGRRLKEQLTALRTERRSVAEDLRLLNQRREDVLEVIQDTNTLRKFRTLQQLLTKREAEIARLQVELEQLDRAANINRGINELKQQRAEQVELTSAAIREGSELYSQIRSEFSRTLKAVIDVPGNLSTSINADGNVEFEAALLQSGATDITTSEDKGTTYRQLMCCAFDMALLSAHTNGSFYRFVYHDGVFEAMDDRKKLKLLDVIRDLTERLGIQYILTVIDADIPRDANDDVVPFREGEIVRELFEGSDQGRLFRMPKF